ncbi:MAG TPA: metal ABC transporter substrate-binding protein [Anaerolineales bacterium]|nr:metal ABC transporter substrate-binding protein [Anaerolineales bacterium]
MQPRSKSISRKTSFILPLILLAGWLAGCTSTPVDPAPDEPFTADASEHDEVEDGDEAVLALPALAPLSLGGADLRIVATTSIIGDVVARVGGQDVELIVLLGPGVDSHSYQPGAQDLIAIEKAHVIFVNGWDLEGGLVHDLETIGDQVLIVPISAGIVPLAAGDLGHDEEAEESDRADDDEQGHDHGPADPHVWFDLHNVERWVENVETVLSALDPARAEVYAANAAVYLAELEDLEATVEAQLALIPPENRLLVTNHDSFRYFARAYGFEVIATVIPAASTLAEPSAGDLAGLVDEMEAHGICTIFTETTVSDALAQTVAAELSGCPEVQVIPLYTEALGPPGSGADSLIGMFAANVDAIARGLK